MKKRRNAAACNLASVVPLFSLDPHFLRMIDSWSCLDCSAVSVRGFGRTAGFGLVAPFRGSAFESRGFSFELLDEVRGVEFLGACVGAVEHCVASPQSIFAANQL